MMYFPGLFLKINSIHYLFKIIFCSIQLSLFITLSLEMFTKIGIVKQSLNRFNNTLAIPNTKIACRLYICRLFQYALILYCNSGKKCL